MPIKTISQELVLEISRGYPDLKLLNLSNNEISVVENLAPLTALERLNLTGNKIAVLRNVASVGEHLLELHAAKNCITAADLRGLQKLVFLDLADNRLTSLEHVQGLPELPALTHLILHGNAVAAASTYHADIARATTCALTSLDGRPYLRQQQRLHTSDGAADVAAVTQAAGADGNGACRHDVEGRSRASPHPLASSDARVTPLQEAQADEAVVARNLERPRERQEESAGVRGEERESAREGARDERGVEGARWTVKPEEETGKEDAKAGEEPKGGHEVKNREGARGCFPHVSGHGEDAGRDTVGSKQSAESCAGELEREKRRCKGLEGHLAETMRLLADERHKVAQFLEREVEQQQQIVELAAEAAAMQQKVRDRDEEIRSWRAYLARAAQAQTDVQMQTEDVGREAEGREALVPLCDKDSKAACNSSATRGGLEAEVQEYKDTVRLLEVQLAATREILALQDRWLVSAGAVSVVNPPARPTADLGSSILTEAGGEVDLAEGGEMWGDAVEAEFAGEAEVVGEKILNEWRQQVYVLLLEQASHEAEHTKKVAALNQNLSHLEHQVVGLRAELEMARKAHVDLKAQVDMHKHQSEANMRQAEALEARLLQAEQQHACELEREQMQLKHLKQERHALVRVLTAASAALTAPALPHHPKPSNVASGAGAMGGGKDKQTGEGERRDGRGAGLEAMTLAESKLTLQHQRLAFAVKRLSVAKSLIQTRAAGAAREHSSLVAQLAQAQNVAKGTGAQHRPAPWQRPEDADTPHGDEACTKCLTLEAELEAARQQACAPVHLKQAANAAGCGSNGLRDDDVQNSLLEEIERLMHERDLLLERLAGHDSRAEAREAEQAAEAERVIKRLTCDCEEARQKLSEALANASADGERVLELEAELGGVVEEKRRACDDLVLSKAALEAEKTRTILAVETAVSAIKEAAEEEGRALRAELLHLQRDNSKHVVQIRQMERQLAAAKNRSERDDVLRLRLLEERLAETQEALRLMRKERNSLMAALRHLQRDEEARSLLLADAAGGGSSAGLEHASPGEPGRGAGCAQSRRTSTGGEVEEMRVSSGVGRAEDLGVGARVNDSRVVAQEETGLRHVSRIGGAQVEGIGSGEQRQESGGARAEVPGERGGRADRQDLLQACVLQASLTETPVRRERGTGGRTCDRTPIRHPLQWETEGEGKREGEREASGTPISSIFLNDTILSADPTPCVKAAHVGEHEGEREAEDCRPSSAKALARRLKVLADGLEPHLSDDSVSGGAVDGDAREAWGASAGGVGAGGSNRGFVHAPHADYSESAMALRQLRGGAEVDDDSSSRGTGRGNEPGRKLDMLAAAAAQLLLED